MLNLVLKDFLIQKKYVATAIIFYPLVALLAFNNLPNSILAFGVILIPYILILGAFYSDGYRVAGIINSLVYMLFLLAPNLFVIYWRRYKTQTDMESFMKKVSSLNIDLNSMLLFLSVVIIILSMLASMRIYENKDIN